jgi:hypothetical protein
MTSTLVETMPIEKTSYNNTTHNNSTQHTTTVHNSSTQHSTTNMYLWIDIRHCKGESKKNQTKQKVIKRFIKVPSSKKNHNISEQILDSKINKNLGQ